MRTAMSLLLALFFFFAAMAPTWGQAPNRSAQLRGGRVGAKPGEIITRPDTSERWIDRLQVGQAAPEFTLPLAAGAGDPALALAADASNDPHRPTASPPRDGDKNNASGAAEATKSTESPNTVSLRELRAQKPAVLIFGSVTCPPFRSQLEDVDQVYRDFRDRAEFLFVYVREAHPDSVLSLVDQRLTPTLIKIPQPTTFEARAATAATCGRSLKLTMPIAVDTIDNRVGRAYAGWPNRMVVVGTDGRILYASPASPRGTDAARLRSWLSENLTTAGR